MADIGLHAVRAGYDAGPPALAGFDLQLPDRSLTAVLGPSGSGKTTLLRVIAGLVAPQAGDVRIGRRSVLDVPAERRGAAMVFQQPHLFPHLDVAGNIGFGLRMRGTDRATIRRQVGDLLDLVQLPGFERRRPGQLSGGQEQRVALARALAVQPTVLLLDEPLSQLDAALRAEMRELIVRLHRELGLTTVFVTHDQEEAATVADTVAVLLDGRLEQHASPHELFDRPATLRVAAFLRTANLIPGHVRDGVWTGPLGRHPADAPDGPAVLAVRQEILQVSPHPTRPDDPAGERPGRRAGGSLRCGVVRSARYQGTSSTVHVEVDDLVLTAVLPPTAKHAPGDLVTVAVPPGYGHVIPTDPAPPEVR